MELNNPTPSRILGHLIGHEVSLEDLDKISGGIDMRTGKRMTMIVSPGPGGVSNATYDEYYTDEDNP